MIKKLKIQQKNPVSSLGLDPVSSGAMYPKWPLELFNEFSQKYKWIIVGFWFTTLTTNYLFGSGAMIMCFHGFRGFLFIVVQLVPPFRGLTN
jgi:hypothetical protein